MKLGRNLIICEICNKEKLHYGLNKCSACLRNFKRKTRPSFYLGTCYSEITRRCKTFDPIRPNYFGKIRCSREEFLNRFVNDEQFLYHYKKWQENEYNRGYAPSIDRIDNKKDYTLDNIMFISQGENSKKDWQHPTRVYLHGKLFGEYDSQLRAALVTGQSAPHVCKCIKLKIVTSDGWFYENF